MRKGLVKGRRAPRRTWSKESFQAPAGFAGSVVTGRQSALSVLPHHRQGRVVASGIPTASTSVVDLTHDQSLPLEFMQLPSVQESAIDDPFPQSSHVVFFGEASNMSVYLGCH